MYHKERVADVPLCSQIFLLLFGGRFLIRTGHNPLLWLQTFRIPKYWFLWLLQMLFCPVCTTFSVTRAKANYGNPSESISLGLARVPMLRTIVTPALTAYSLSNMASHLALPCKLVNQGFLTNSFRSTLFGHFRQAQRVTAMLLS